MDSVIVMTINDNKISVTLDNTEFHTKSSPVNVCHVCLSVCRLSCITFARPILVIFISPYNSIAKEEEK